MQNLDGERLPAVTAECASDCAGCAQVCFEACLERASRLSNVALTCAFVGNFVDYRHDVKRTATPPRCRRFLLFLIDELLCFPDGYLSDFHLDAINFVT